jgi:hypothetical protein
MNCLSLNCRGCGNVATIRELEVLIKTHIPKMVFLCETRQKSRRMEKLKRMFGMGGYVGYDSDGMSEGLALFWHESMQVDVKEVNGWYIDVFIRESVSSPQWHATFVYGEPSTDQRHNMWSLLCALRVTFRPTMVPSG